MRLPQLSRGTSTNCPRDEAKIYRAKLQIGDWIGWGRQNSSLLPMPAHTPTAM